MHRHRLVLNGPPVAIARLADDLRAAGAVAVAGPTAGPPRLIWETAQSGTLEGLCARHRDVAVGVERFELLGDELERLVVRGREATVLERCRLDGGARELDEALQPGGVCLEEDGAPLDPAALRAAARSVMAVAADLGPGPSRSAADDALRVGRAAGHLCATVAEDGPGARGGAGIAALAATALSLGATGSACEAERSFERDWRLTQAIARAGQEVLWSRPGEAEWSEWLMDLLIGVARVLDGCSACLHQPPPPFVSLQTEHIATEAEELERAVGRLVTTALQALVLFERGSRQ